MSSTQRSSTPPPSDSSPAPSQEPNPTTNPADAQEEAYDPETGEINWDCPCLENMTKPPCGEAFKAAFSCFVYSKEEPKGVDCIEAFREMQKCFREHPEIYGEEIDDEDDDEEEEERVKGSDKPGEPERTETGTQVLAEQPQSAKAGTKRA
ncbi:uncharacterized protein SPPG_04221 [Spizellomyces punctatus DAOM BR117]|uniref:Mitochondrial intermembrane space import and assembly protein 40 n=1 Tax=Spizellomyces punctatus (strain DAOM BR117) TaxID=645134 RepID=A0A0L0HJS4_SPIPD|nr:uncharacterized protein SPPG_04221 [Spizellomyces punctatus DAOM BR117]KND01130.1 hypothetical protein SPPG_04221 [Spizellomyces punctatus DAOM BR117]|eukprot:XP_016609169.1 hypothetical protein SPPG_04221 [Spizellomyces punctatus DAOM BR117]